MNKLNSWMWFIILSVGGFLCTFALASAVKGVFWFFK